MNTFVKDDKALYNSRIIDNYLKLVKKRYPEVDLNELLVYAQMKTYQVADQAHWFTQKQIDCFYEKLVQLTSNERIGREAGRYSASPDALGIMRQYALGLVGPSNAFKLIGQASSNFTKSAIYQSESLGPNKVRITVTPHKGVREKVFQCENRFGFWEAIVTMMGYKNPQIEHPKCLFKGDPSCTYIVSWEKTTSLILKRVRLYIGTAFIPVIIAASIYEPDFTLQFLSPILLIFFVILSLIIENREKRRYLIRSVELRIPQMNCYLK